MKLSKSCSRNLKSIISAKNDEWPTKRPYLMNRKYDMNEEMKPYKNGRHEAQAV